VSGFFSGAGAFPDAGRSARSRTLERRDALPPSALKTDAEALR